MEKEGSNGERGGGTQKKESKRKFHEGEGTSSSNLC